jgi:glycosyltransferase involved in cell wall biosynthesis
MSIWQGWTPVVDARNSPLSPELSIIIPAFNKESCILETLDEVVKVIEGTNYSFEIIIIDDFSTDKTLERIKSLNIPQLRIVMNEKNFGKGYSIRRGISSCLATKYVGYIDADLDIKPDALLTAIEYLEQDLSIEICIGSKFHFSSIVQSSRLRKIQSYCFAKLFKFLFKLDIADSQSGLKLGRVEQFRRLASQTQIHGFAFDVELLFLAHRKEVRIVEIPITLSGNYLTTMGIMSTLRSVYDLFAIHHRISKIDL